MSDDATNVPMEPVEGGMGTEEGMEVEKPLEEGEEGEGSTMPEETPAE